MSVILIKAIRLHLGILLQVYMEGMVVTKVVFEGMVEVESVVVAVVDMSVESDVVISNSVGMVVKVTMAAITELAI